MRIVRVIVAVAVAGCVGFAGLKSASGAEMKIGFIDVEKIFNEYEYTKKEDAKLKDAGRQKAQERDSMVADIKRLKEESELLSESASKEKELLVDEKIKDLKDFDRRARTELRNERDELLKKIFEDIRVIIEGYGKKNGYTFIFNDKALLYKIDSYDVTDDIIELLNEQYKKKK